MNINSIGNGAPVQRPYPNVRREISSDAGTLAPGTTDKVDLSTGTSAVQTGGIRADKVAAIKAQIAAGTYETDDKIDVAVNKLLDILGNDD